MSLRHPSRTATPLRLYGRRVMLRPLAANDFREWSEVRRRNDDWLTVWEPSRPVHQSDPVTRPLGVHGVAACSATVIGRTARPTSSGLFLDQHVAGEVNLNNVVRGAMQSAHDRLLDRPGPRRQRIHRRSGRRGHPVRVRATRPAPRRDLHRPAQRAEPAGDGEAPHPRRRARPALPRDQRRLGGPHPLRHDRGGMDKTDATNSSPTGSRQLRDVVGSRCIRRPAGRAPPGSRVQ